MSAPASVARYASIADEAAHKYGENPALLLADIDQESGGSLVSSTGSDPGVGDLTQFLPSTAAEYDVKLGSTLEDVRSQIFGQAEYLAKLGVNSNPTAALEGYNSGTIGDPVSAGYAASVLAKEREYEGATGSYTPTDTTSSSTGSSVLSNAPEGISGLIIHGAMYLAFIVGGIALVWLGAKTALKPRSST